MCALELSYVTVVALHNSVLVLLVSTPLPPGARERGYVSPCSLKNVSAIGVELSDDGQLAIEPIEPGRSKQNITYDKKNSMYMYAAPSRPC